VETRYHTVLAQVTLLEDLDYIKHSCDLTDVLATGRCALLVKRL